MTLKFFIPTFLFYVVAIAAVLLLTAASPSGPCTPGSGVFSFLLLLPVCAGLVIKNIYRTFTKNRANLVIAMLHSFALVMLLNIVHQL